MTTGTKLTLASQVSSPSVLDTKETPLQININRLSSEIESKLIKWRREIHQNPELSNREYRTSKFVAEHLKKLGMDVRIGIAKTGVIGVLKGGSPGPVVALRADMDALPMTEMTDLPYASQTKDVMHACGHDIHTAILMGTASVLSKISQQIPGTVKFIFQPSEEGAPEGEEGGARLMIKEGALDNPKPDAIFALHVAQGPFGFVGYRPGNAMASGDIFSIKIKGSQTHGALPWLGIDPIVVASQIVIGLQSIISRQTNLTTTPAVISIGKISGGERFNTIPDKVEIIGTIRVIDQQIRKDIHERLKNTAEYIAKSAGASVEIHIKEIFSVINNDPVLTQRVIPTLQRLFGQDAIIIVPPLTGSDDFCYYQERIPGLYILAGVTPPGSISHPIHSPYFSPDERILQLGVRTMSNMAIDYMTHEQTA